MNKHGFLLAGIVFAVMNVACFIVYRLTDVFISLAAMAVSLCLASGILILIYKKFQAVLAERKKTEKTGLETKNTLDRILPVFISSVDSGIKCLKLFSVNDHVFIGRVPCAKPAELAVHGAAEHARNPGFSGSDTGVQTAVWMNEENPELINSCMSRADEFISVIRNFSREIGRRNVDDLYVKREDLQKLILRYSYCTEMVHMLISSVLKQINECSRPLSEEMFLIKKIMFEFTGKMMGWKNDISDRESRDNFDAVIAKYNKQIHDYGHIFSNLQVNFRLIEQSFSSIQDMIANIYANSEQIEDISTRINLLSINAAIESSKAGVYGKGFKVISDEIEKLSETTRQFAGNIKSAIQETGKTAGSALSGFRENDDSILRKIGEHKREYEDFYELLNDYNEEFKKIFSLVETTSGEINTHINRVNPVFQVHDISVQQIENLDKLISTIHKNDDAGNGLVNVFSTLDTEQNIKILNDLLSLVESIATTDNELKIAGAMAGKYGLGRKITTGSKKSGEIELF